jgi:hypothetical protein
MKNLFMVLMGISGVVGISYYDKYLNRDVNSIVLRNSEQPFYSSSSLYSSHYAKLNINISKSNGSYLLNMNNNYNDIKK